MKCRLSPDELGWADRLQGSGCMREWIELLDMPEWFGEYVTVHERVHRLALNHGRVFRPTLKSYMPDWSERKALRREYVHAAGQWMAEKPGVVRRGRADSRPGG